MNRAEFIEKWRPGTTIRLPLLWERAEFISDLDALIKGVYESAYDIGRLEEKIKHI